MSMIPIKCFTCGNVIADKYFYYLKEVDKIKRNTMEGSDDTGSSVFNIVYLTKDNAKKTPEADVLDKIGLKNVCCRRHMLTHVEIE